MDPEAPASLLVTFLERSDKGGELGPGFKGTFQQRISMLSASVPCFVEFKHALRKARDFQILALAAWHLMDQDDLERFSMLPRRQIAVGSAPALLQRLEVL